MKQIHVRTLTNLNEDHTEHANSAVTQLRNCAADTQPRDASATLMDGDSLAIDHLINNHPAASENVSEVGQNTKYFGTYTL